MNSQQLNPWSEMERETRRRVEHETCYDYFWIVDYNQRYGFYMKLNMSNNVDADISLKGIDLSMVRTNDDKLEIFLILEARDDWEIFQALCFDLISVIDIHVSDEIKIRKLLERLDKWKNLLANKRQLGLSIEEQMGIFSELYCMNNIIASKLGYNVAVKSWVGMEKDKQDFSLDDSVIEVKSHRTTKGNIASISSLSQLYSEKDKFFMVSYGLTASTQGLTIDDLYGMIMSHLSGNDKELLTIKLFETGWIPYNEKLKKEKFIVDSEVIYEIGAGFPKIDYNLIDHRIIKVRYKIDLTKCDEFIRTINDIFGGE